MQDTFKHEPDNLIISGGMPAVAISINVASGKVERGTLLSFVSIDPKTNVVTVAPINLSGEGEAKVPYCIAQHGIDATKAAKQGTAWATGSFNARSVILPASVKIADVYLACRKVGIFLDNAHLNPSA
ncbi:MAG: head decoration protein [Candidatus Symbiopectobacterium sp. Dall1.0]|nr:head decoration protein [Candidatus Symbiopectobacterium sp. Dall1.0]